MQSVCVLIGLLRSFGRCAEASSTPLICRIFPCPFALNNEQPEDEKKDSAFSPAAAAPLKMFDARRFAFNFSMGNTYFITIKIAYFSYTVLPLLIMRPGALYFRVAKRGELFVREL